MTHYIDRLKQMSYEQLFNECVKMHGHIAYGGVVEAEDYFKMCYLRSESHHRNDPQMCERAKVYCFKRDAAH